MQPLGSRNRIALLGLSVGLVLGDSSVVTLALPKILVQFDVEVSTLAWALISFNLALALAAVPAAALARRRPVGVAQGAACPARGVVLRTGRAPAEARPPCW